MTHAAYLLLRKIFFYYHKYSFKAKVLSALYGFERKKKSHILPVKLLKTKVLQEQDFFFLLGTE